MLAAALFMRLFVPAGWMPVADAAGVHFELCPGWTAKPQPEPAAHMMHHAGHHQPAHHQPPHDHGKKHGDQPCAFAGLGMAFVETIAPAMIQEPAYPAVLPQRIPTVVPGRGLAAPPPPSTGPPLLA